MKRGLYKMSIQIQDLINSFTVKISKLVEELVLTEATLKATERELQEYMQLLEQKENEAKNQAEDKPKK